MYGSDEVVSIDEVKVIHKKPRCTKLQVGGIEQPGRT